jgi:predicted permease
MRRRRELTIRHSLGASRARIVRQLLAESSVLAAAAALLAVAGAFVLPRLAAGVVGARPVDLSPGGRVVAVAAGLALFTVLISSLAPALRATRRLVTTPRQGSEARLRLRSSLLALQVAVSAILLIGAALFTRSFVRAATFDPGFAVDEVTIVSILPSADTPAAARAERGEAMTEAVHASFREAGLPPPGAASLLPLSSSRMTTGVRRPGEDEGANLSALTLDVSPGYFDVLRVPITAGRVFTDADGPDAVVINESLANRLWPGESAVGRTLLGGGGGFERRIVGVAAGAYLTSLDRVEPTLFRRVSGRSPSIGAQTLLLPDDRALVDRARAAALAVDPGGRVVARPLRAQMQRALELPLMAAAIAGVIGLIAVALASVGVFGVFSYVVEERTGEIGIRMALGARGTQVIGLVFRQTSWPLAGGLALGFVASLVATPVLRAYLIGVGPHDPLAFLGVVVVLAVAAAVATLLPARRAAYVDPAITLRHD